MRSGLVTLEPGAECGEHSTKSHEELIVCLAGEGEIEAAGRTTPLAAGHMAYNPPNTLHNVRNSGATPMRYLFIVAPAPGEGAGTSSSAG
jgi:quercetin dioxygenase-like cupin family protein